ncbi:MAG: metallophosphoesterase [Butyricicoccus pullicaecorum]|nr:metallophosphoesterase [Butyricicoccus pullicaecorum]
MKIVFLHLSDLHLQDYASLHSVKIQAVVDSLSSYKPFDGIVIILSGDIAATGSSNEYKNAATLLGRLTSHISKKYLIKEKNLKILIVPGNHDINWSKSPRQDPSKIRAYTEAQKIIQLKNELKGMISYFRFSDKNQCFFASNVVDDSDNENPEIYNQLVTRKILHFDNSNNPYLIEANLINSAPFSCDSDDGLHYLPEGAIKILTNPSHASLSIIIMHHSPDWFEFSLKKKLENIISRRCSLAFYGHEHISGTQHIFYDNGNRIVKQAGGAWWQKESPSLSEYYAAVFDTDTRQYILNKFDWDSTSSTFTSVAKSYHTLTPKSLVDTGLVYQENYIATLMKNDKNTTSEDLSGCTIFPGLRFGGSKEYARGNSINNMADFISYIKKNKYVAIVGGSNSGKTVLCKMLFKQLLPEFTVLYCGTDDITGRSQENILKELVRNTYGENSYNSFKNISSDKKAIIIDDLHRISHKHLDKFLRDIENIFGIIIIATEETAQFDVVQMIKDNVVSNKEFNKVYIARLYAEKRSELINKIVLQKNNNDKVRALGIVRKLEQFLNSYKISFRTEIDFVVQFVDYYCSHIGELDKSDATVFTKVFEASIERSISPHLEGRRENANDIIVALSEIAYYIHFHKEYPISAEHVNQVIQDYCEYYDNRYLTTKRFIDIVTASGLLQATSSGFEYRFMNKNRLAYFVAKALNRRFHDTADSSDLEAIVRESCFSINGDILLFMTYISDNVNIPKLLLQQAQLYTCEWHEFDFANISAKYLESMPLQKLPQPTEHEKEKEIHERSIIEEESDTRIETLDIYDYDETKIDQLNNQLMRASLQLQIIARNFSAFTSILPAHIKKDYVKTMYELPNKIFKQWTDFIDKNIDSLIDALISWQESADFDGEKLSQKEFLQFFQDVSLHMLLNLYYMTSAYGASDNTVDYLSQQDYIPSSINYRIERLMFWEKVDDCASVMKEAEALYNELNNGMAKSIVLIILRHMLVHSNVIIDRERRRIANKYFTPAVRTSILIDREKAKKEDGI